MITLRLCVVTALKVGDRAEELAGAARGAVMARTHRFRGGDVEVAGGNDERAAAQVL
ncbi:hypothetical protein GCM10010442_73800 [Kitasatospora kifunensis]